MHRKLKKKKRKPPKNTIKEEVLQLGSIFRGGMRSQKRRQDWSGTLIPLEVPIS